MAQQSELDPTFDTPLGVLIPSPIEHQIYPVLSMRVRGLRGRDIPDSRAVRVAWEDNRVAYVSLQTAGELARVRDRREYKHPERITEPPDWDEPTPDPTAVIELLPNE